MRIRGWFAVAERGRVGEECWEEMSGKYPLPRPSHVLARVHRCPVRIVTVLLYSRNALPERSSKYGDKVQAHPSSSSRIPSRASSCQQPDKKVKAKRRERRGKESLFRFQSRHRPSSRNFLALAHSSQPYPSATNQPNSPPLSTRPPHHHHAQLSMQRLPEPVQDERRRRGHVSALLALQQQLRIEDLLSRRCRRPPPFQQRKWIGWRCLWRCLRRPQRAGLPLCRVQQDAVSASRRRLLQPLW